MVSNTWKSGEQQRYHSICKGKQLESAYVALEGLIAGRGGLSLNINVEFNFLHCPHTHWTRRSLLQITGHRFVTQSGGEEQAVNPNNSHVRCLRPVWCFVSVFVQMNETKAIWTQADTDVLQTLLNITQNQLHSRSWSSPQMKKGWTLMRNKMALVCSCNLTHPSLKEK